MFKGPLYAGMADRIPSSLVLLYVVKALIHLGVFLREKSIVPRPNKHAKAFLTGMNAFFALSWHGPVFSFIYFQF